MEVAQILTAGWPEERGGFQNRLIWQDSWPVLNIRSRLLEYGTVWSRLWELRLRVAWTLARLSSRILLNDL